MWEREGRSGIPGLPFLRMEYVRREKHRLYLDVGRRRWYTVFTPTIDRRCAA